MTLDIEKLRVLCAKATESPWWISEDDGAIMGGDGDEVFDVGAVDWQAHNVEWLLAARTALPAALDEIERLRERVCDREHDLGVSLHLDEYEAANLLWLLRMANQLGLANGDWHAQIESRFAGKDLGQANASIADGCIAAEIALGTVITAERDVALARAEQYLTTMETIQAAIEPRATELQRLQAEVERMRPVYEAALFVDRAQCDGGGLCATTDLDHEDHCSIVVGEQMLRAAINAARSKETP
jgi:hypothetical protein